MTDGSIAPGERLALAAASMIGTPFRLHGRNPATGLDCVGLVAASLAKIGRNPSVPQGYSLRNSSIAAWLTHFAQSGFQPAVQEDLAGDVIVTSPGPLQHHLMILGSPKFAIHAHAGLRRVVRQPLSLNKCAVARWRLTTDN